VNVQVLIDAIVRQTMVLVAQLATTAGMRAPLAHVANQVFLELVGELESQGVRQKVIADMFGLALRSYQRKVQRLLASESEQGGSLWEAVLSHVEGRGTASRADVLRRFHYDDEAMVRGVLDDLVSTGLVYRRGRGDATVYRAASADELREDAGADHDADESAAHLVWLAIYRNGPLSREALGTLVRLEPEALDRALRRLEADARISSRLADDGQPLLEAGHFFTAYEDPKGWEAALFDHYQALVTAIVTKLRRGATTATQRDVTGGSTYSFDIGPGHPHEERVLGFLSRVRREADALLADVHAYNQASPGAPRPMRVSFYVGQSARADSEEEDQP
jgi:hypothetical protein